MLALCDSSMFSNKFSKLFSSIKLKFFCIYCLYDGPIYNSILKLIYDLSMSNFLFLKSRCDSLPESGLMGPISGNIVTLLKILVNATNSCPTFKPIPYSKFYLLLNHNNAFYIFWIGISSRTPKVPSKPSSETCDQAAIHGQLLPVSNSVPVINNGRPKYPVLKHKGFWSHSAKTKHSARRKGKTSNSKTTSSKNGLKKYVYGMRYRTNTWRLN